MSTQALAYHRWEHTDAPQTHAILEALANGIGASSADDGVDVPEDIQRVIDSILADSTAILDRAADFRAAVRRQQKDAIRKGFLAPEAIQSLEDDSSKRFSYLFMNSLLPIIQDRDRFKSELHQAHQHLQVAKKQLSEQNALLEKVAKNVLDDKRSSSWIDRWILETRFPGLYRILMSNISSRFTSANERVKEKGQANVTPESGSKRQ
ncbi:MAG: hypothetical protein IPK29_15325 [Betaproteobacteria bacterium]|nr:hypothetical protein [Betaproteobacteria bacterium]